MILGEIREPFFFSIKWVIRRQSQVRFMTKEKDFAEISPSLMAWHDLSVLLKNLGIKVPSARERIVVFYNTTIKASLSSHFLQWMVDWDRYLQLRAIGRQIDRERENSVGECILAPSGRKVKQRSLIMKGVLDVTCSSNGTAIRVCWKTITWIRYPHGSKLITYECKTFIMRNIGYHYVVVLSCIIFFFLFFFMELIVL